ncbi:uncharacterized protein LOC126747884 [Anthonomus grandis grandis]|uniref:uncharacterized protein LOC126747884 n=1 Tax=Anthonomus grandis grandis TaxID=2921223 RepID=UPI0021657A08|nr:uncharacterized protein LOC126747884 [Anthonomus grandis grandis]
MIIRTVWCLICILYSFLAIDVYCGETYHRTKAASEKHHDLWCHKCDSFIDGNKCVTLSGNHSFLHHKCTREQKKCQVRRISMSTSTEEVTGKPKLWLLQRECVETCEGGCIIIGERTKLHSCITCCDDHNFCNSGSGGTSRDFFGGTLIQFLWKQISFYLT